MTDFTDRIKETNALNVHVDATVNPNAHFGLGQGEDIGIKVNRPIGLPPDLYAQVSSIVRQMFGPLFWEIIPPELADLCWNHAGAEPPSGNYVATVVDEGTAWTPTGTGGLRVKGTPGYGKGVFSRGFTRTNVDDDWWGDNGPTDPDDDDHDPANRGNYSTDESTLQAWLPCWDYPRVY